jgi:uncharacterized protein (TIGR02246 family)
MDTHTDTRTAPTIADTSTDHTDDLTAIRALVADVEAGFNANDPELIVRPFAENATAVGVNGALLEGRSAALEASRALLAGPLRDQRARYELEDVTFLRPDVAIGHKLAWALDEDGRPKDVGHAMIALYVFVKEGDTWWVASRQNTLAVTG